MPEASVRVWRIHAGSATTSKSMVLPGEARHMVCFCSSEVDAFSPLARLCQSIHTGQPTVQRRYHIWITGLNILVVNSPLLAGRYSAQCSGQHTLPAQEAHSSRPRINGWLQTYQGTWQDCMSLLTASHMQAILLNTLVGNGGWQARWLPASWSAELTEGLLSRSSCPSTGGCAVHCNACAGAWVLPPCQ